MKPGPITRLLHDLREGAPGAEDRLFDCVYDELREIAARRLACVTFENRRHLFFAYTRVMRQVLVDRARRACTTR